MGWARSAAAPPTRGGDVFVQRTGPRLGAESLLALGPLRLLGSTASSFLVAESEAGLVLVDQHVAHERVRYERILARLEAADAASQSLLIPVPFEATPDEAALLARADELLAAAGFVVSERGARTFVVTAAPADMPAAPSRRFSATFSPAPRSCPREAAPRRGAARRSRRRSPAAARSP